MNLHKFRYIFIRFVRLLVPVIAMIAASIAMVTFTKQITFTSKQEKAVADRMYEYFYSGLINGRFDEVFYKTAFSHYDRKSDGALTKYGYVETLEDFVVFIVEKGKSSDDKVKIDYYDQATALLKKAKETEPFASLPSEEKRLMNNVQLFIQNNDVSNALNSLNELKQVILSRHKE